MKLNGLSDLTPTEARVERWTASLPAPLRPVTTAPVNEELVTEKSARTWTFDYPNYNDDPRPKVMVLGYWQNPKTGKNLLGGLNINYMTDAEVAQVVKVLPILMRPKDLKARYWAGRKLLPSIFNQFYRTYNRDYVQKITPDELGADGQKLGKLDPAKVQKAVEFIKQQREQPAPEKDPTKDAGKEPAKEPAKPADKPAAPVVAQPVAQPKDVRPDPEIEKPDTKPVSDKLGLDKGGQSIDPKALLKLIGLKKQAAEPKQPAPKTPAPAPAPTPASAPVPQKPGIQFKKRVSAAPKQATQPPQPPPKAVAPQNTGPNPKSGVGMPKGDKKQQADELSTPPNDKAGTQQESVVRRGAFGFVWPSRFTYREYHRPAAFLTTPALSEAPEAQGRPLLAVYDVRTGETLMDRVEDHAAIIDEAGWDYSHVIRLLPVRDDGEVKIIPIHDGLPAAVVESAMRRLPALVIDHLLNSN